jgi:methionine biosynthesis protein MetW
MSVKEYYNEYWSSTGFHPTGQTDAAVCRLLKQHIDPGLRVLDVGCGDGLAAGSVLRDQGDYVGVDVSENAVREAKEHGFDVGVIEDAESLPFGDNEFDAVVSLEVIEHLLFPLRAVQEATRVLKPGGAMLLTTPNTAYWRLRIDMLLLGKWNPLGDTLAVQEPWRDPHVRFFTIGSLRKMLEATGLESIYVGGCKGHFIKSLPGVQRFLGNFLPQEASPLYRRLEKVWPSALANRLYVVARKPSHAEETTTLKNQVLKQHAA